MAKKGFPRVVNASDGKAVPLTGRIVTVGSSKECRVRLDGRKAPDVAAHLMFVAGSYQLHVIAEECKLTVNGEPVSSGSRPLSHGDTFAVAGSEFVFQEHEDELSITTPDKSSAASDPLSGLISVVVSLLSNRDADVATDLVASLSRLLRCDAARLVGSDPETGERTTIAVFPRGIGKDRFSRRAIDWASQADRTVLFGDEDWRESEESMASLVRNLVASVLCAPLHSGDEVLGFLYLDRLQKSDPFTEEDREFCDSLLPLFSSLLANATQQQRQRDTISRLQEDTQLSKGGMVYESKAMTEVVEQARKLAGTTSPVLVLGETGTGKELMARFLHENSPRAGNPYHAVNCGAIPENLMESELFGHEKGAFTGASKRKEGLFEATNGGTILLDEIGELPLQLQVKLLRVLQESEIVRVGGTETIQVDVRVIAATNRDLEEDVRQGRFRQDLYFRLNVLTMTLPPLRERGQDALLLANFFLKKYCEQFGMPLRGLSSSAQSVLSSHHWPGNIRELENTIQRAVVLSDGSALSADDIRITDSPLFNAGTTASLVVTTIKEARNKAEREIIEQTLSRTRGNISLTARSLEIDRKWLMKKMEELEISADTYR